MHVHFVPLREPTSEIAQAFTRWESDPELTPLTRPNQTGDPVSAQVVTADDLIERLVHDHIFLIYIGDTLVGEMNYQIDPAVLMRKEPGSAWIGITIGEAEGRGKGIGSQALGYLEQQIAAAGLARIELGVFAFNHRAIALYRKQGYQQIGVVEKFTYWKGEAWDDIRMEKRLRPLA